VHHRMRIGAGALCALGLAGLLALSLAVSSATAAVPAWSTYDHDGLRSASDPDSGTPVAPVPAWGAEAALDGQVFAQPLVYGSQMYVATENDTIYALDAATGAVVWHRSVGTAVPSADLPCGDISPTVGITSTPVIDAFNGRLYAVLDNLTGTTVQHRLIALDLATGNPVAGFPVPVDPLGSDPKALLQRASLALAGGRVIIPYGGNSGDCGTYHGWLVSVAQDGSGTPSTFEADPGSGDHGGAIWGSGDAPSVDAAGHIFASTGNGFPPAGATTPDLQESVVELDPSLNMLAHWTASNWQALDSSDQDLGSSEPLPLPGGLLFAAGKDGVGRLLSAGALGTAGQVFSAPACGSGGVFGASLYRAGVIYVPCAGGLVALSLSLSPSPSFTVMPGFSAPAAASGPPVFAGGLVWSTGWRGSQILYGLDPATGAIRFQQSQSPGIFNHFTTPSAGGGRLFVAVGSNVTALRISSFPPPSNTTLVASANPSRADAPVTLTAIVGPLPNAGTVSFEEAGSALAGCGAAAVNPFTGRASCRASLPAGSHTLRAVYSGDQYFAASTSTPLAEIITAGATKPPARPKLSAVRLGSHRFTARRGTRLQLTLSEPAALQVQISRTLSGRRIKRGRCRAGAKRGTRCVIDHRARRLKFHGRRGRNSLRLNLARLSAGHYIATVLARATGGTSRTVTVRFEIVRPAH
jgi:polyvinyl alcohol dehydrogenase (cytochrome)